MPSTRQNGLENLIFVVVLPQCQEPHSGAVSCPRRSLFRPTSTTKPTGQARVRVNGKDIWLGKFDSPESHEKYARIVAELAARASVGKSAPAPLPTGNALSIAELLLAYWNHAQDYYRKDGKPTSEVASLRWALRPVRELYGKTPAAEFGPLALKAVRQKFIESGMAPRHGQPKHRPNPGDVQMGGKRRTVARQRPTNHSKRSQACARGVPRPVRPNPCCPSMMRRLTQRCPT